MSDAMPTSPKTAMPRVIFYDYELPTVEYDAGNVPGYVNVEFDRRNGLVTISVRDNEQHYDGDGTNGHGSLQMPLSHFVELFEEIEKFLFPERVRRE